MRHELFAGGILRNDIFFFHFLFFFLFFFYFFSFKVVAFFSSLIYNAFVLQYRTLLGRVFETKIECKEMLVLNLGIPLLNLYGC